METPEIKRAMGDSDEASDVRMLMELIGAVTNQYVQVHPDPRQAMAYMITALPLFAGTVFAQMVFAGDMDQSQQARCAKSCAHNFREGVKVGMKRMTRLAHEEGIVGAMQ